MQEKTPSSTTNPFLDLNDFPDLPPPPPAGAEPEPPKVNQPKTAEEYGNERIRREARKIAPNALKALRELLDPDSEKYKNATPAQILKAADLVLNRAGDRPAIAEPSNENNTNHYLVIDRTSMPSPRNAATT